MLWWLLIFLINVQIFVLYGYPVQKQVGFHQTLEKFYPGIFWWMALLWMNGWLYMHLPEPKHENFIMWNFWETFRTQL